MIKPLRNRHRLVWMAWALLLPLGIAFAWLAIPDQPAIRLLQNQPTTLLPVIVQSASSPDYSVNIRSDNQRSEWQLEWKNKKVLKVPSAVIYLANDTTDSFRPGGSRLIGRIEAQGTYMFAVNPDSSINKPLNLVLYDFIHNKRIETIQLK